MHTIVKRTKSFHAIVVFGCIGFLCIFLWPLLYMAIFLAAILTFDYLAFPINPTEWSMKETTSSRSALRPRSARSTCTRPKWTAPHPTGPTIISSWRKTKVAYTTRCTTSLWSVTAAITLDSTSTTKCRFSDNRTNKQVLPVNTFIMP